MSIPSSVLQIASIGATLFSGLASFSGQRQEAAAQQAAANYQAAVARRNAALAERAAKDAIERGKVEEGAAAAEARRLIGRQRVVLAGGGQDVGLGSALDITSETAALSAIDQATIRRNAELEAADLRTRGAGFTSEAGFLEGEEVTNIDRAVTGEVRAPGPVPARRSGLWVVMAGIAVILAALVLLLLK